MQKNLLARQFSSEKFDGIEAARRLLSSGLTEINLEIHQAMVFFERNDIGDIQVGVGEQIELALQVKIEQSLHGTVRRDNAGFYSCIAQFLLDFHPFFVAPYFRPADGDGKPAPPQILQAWLRDDVGRLF